MQILLIIGFFMSLFLFFLIVGKRDKISTDRFLLCMFAVYALTIGGAYLEVYNRGNDYPYPHLMNISWLFLLLHGPFIWLYIKSLMVSDFRYKHIHLLHFTPFVLFFILQYFSFLRLPGEEKLLIVQNELFRNSLLFKVSIPYIGISTITYNVWALILLRKHRLNMENHFSNIENIDLKWLKTLVIVSLVVFSINVFLYNLNNIIQFAGYYELSQIAYIFATFYVLYLGFFGIRQGKIFVDYPTIALEQNRKTIKQEALKINEKKDFSKTINKLIRLMEQEQHYLDPELNLSRLSNLLQTKPEVLSEVLNSSLNQNFFDYINKYRIEEFKIQCLNKDNMHLSILGIAYECGFNSKAAFYRAFNKFEGNPPTTYISRVS